MVRVAHAVRRWMRLGMAVLTLAVIAAPSAFGPAAGLVMRELGAASQQHVCKCGMPAGKCGCPECDRLEQQRLREHVPDRIASLRRHCDDDAPPVPSGVLPARALACASSAMLPVPRGERVAVAEIAFRLCSPDDEPATPPPRSASV